jgi:GMP synthase (glutamine-hydrolysing)
MLIEDPSFYTYLIGVVTRTSDFVIFRAFVTPRNGANFLSRRWIATRNCVYHQVMRKVLIFQHVAHEILGTLNPLLKQRGLRLRYVNFERSPDEQPSLEKYDGLIVLGGHMGVYEAEEHKHIKTEMKLIEQALAKGIPILGICLGAQILAHVLGATVRRSVKKEIGWCDLELTSEGQKDPLLSHFQKTERIFQMHGDTFEIPKSAVHLASSAVCAGQAFRFNDNVYGLQFHLEVDQAMILRWIKNQRHRERMIEGSGVSPDDIERETAERIEHSMNLSRQSFQKFIELFHLPERPVLLGSGHGKTTKENK